MATLGELLEHRHGVAKAAAGLRCYRETLDLLEKCANDKEAASFAGIFRGAAGALRATGGHFKSFGGALGEGIGRVGKNILHATKNLGKATEVSNELEASQMAIGSALKHHFDTTIGYPKHDGTPQEMKEWATKVHNYISAPAFMETTEKAYNPVSKEWDPKSMREVPVPSRGNAALKAMGDVQRNLEPRKGGINAAVGVLGVSGLAGTMIKEKFFHGHKKNLDSILADPQIPKSHHGRAKAVFEMVSKYAPSIASDPTVSKDVTKNLIRYDTIDHKTVKDLMDAERIFNEVHGRKAQFDSMLNQMSGAPSRGKR